MSEIDLRFGRWEDVLSDVECDALIVDAPYSARTHSGHDGGTGSANRAEPGRVNRSTGQVEKGWKRRAITYSAWTRDDACAFVASWAPRTRGWFVSITDHVLAPAWAEALELAGRYVFLPIACVEPGSRVRLTGDGPTQWSTWCIVARPKAAPFHKWGSLPGAYVVPLGEREVGGGRKPVVGGKALWLMRTLVRDYTRRDDLVCDPCAGGGTTLLAAASLGRRAVGAECMKEHFDIAQKRISRGWQPSIFNLIPEETSAPSEPDPSIFDLAEESSDV